MIWTCKSGWELRNFGCISQSVARQKVSIGVQKDSNIGTLAKSRHEANGNGHSSVESIFR